MNRAPIEFKSLKDGLLKADALVAAIDHAAVQQHEFAELLEDLLYRLGVAYGEVGDVK